MSVFHNISLATFLGALTPVPTYGGIITAVGDSLTVGLTGTSYPIQLVALNTYFTQTTRATSGWTVTNLTADETNTDALRVTTSPCFCIVWIGTNDMGIYGGSAADTLSAVQAYCLRRKAAGYRVIVLDIITRQNPPVGQSTFDALRATYNSLLASSYSSFADGLVQVSTITQLQDYTNTTYFADGTHLTTTGYGLVASAVNTVLDSVSKSPVYLTDESGNYLIDDSSNYLTYL